MSEIDKAKVTAVIEACLKDIDTATEPEKMSKHEAKEVLEEIKAGCDSRIESLVEELADEDD